MAALFFFFRITGIWIYSQKLALSHENALFNELWDGYSLE